MVTVVTGSSNSVEGTWPEILSAQFGWDLEVFSIGGGGFTQSGPSRFITQLRNAAASIPNPNDVEYLFVGDASNDIRATSSVLSEASEFFSEAESTFPNARIIVIPALWGMAELNLIPSRMLSVTQRFQELQEAALGTRVEVIPWSWLWHWDSPNWMKPKTATESGVHHTAAGYARVAEFVARYLQGGDTDNPIGWKYIFGVNGVYVDESTAWLRARRNGNDIHLQGRISLSQNVPEDGHLGWLPRGLSPLENVRVPVISDTRKTGWVDVFSSGQVRAFTSLSGSTSRETWNFNSVLPAF